MDATVVENDDILVALSGRCLCNSAQFGTALEAVTGTAVTPAQNRPIDYARVTSC